MNEELQDILDDCLNRVLGGELDIAGCLERYPQLADELEGLLQTALLLRAPETLPHPDTILQGERRLLQAVEAKRREARPTSFKDRIIRTLTLPHVQARWAGVAAALAVLILGAATVVVSGSAGPGEPLYWVKRTTESTRLALTQSEAAKARLHIGLAERRVEDISRLASEGDTQFLASLTEDIEHHLQKAQAIALAGVRPEVVSDLRARLESSSSAQLALLQEQLGPAAEEVQLSVSAAFTAVGEGYGLAIEELTTASPPLVMSGGLGLLQIFATDPPPPDLEAVLVEVREVEVHRAGGADSGWVTLVQEPVSFDLLRVADIAQLLGSKEIEPGVYTQVRLVVSKATVVANGIEYPAEVPGGRLRLTRPFRVEPGKTTALLLDFDGLRSVKVTGANQFKLTPQVKVLALEPMLESADGAGAPDVKSGTGTGRGGQAGRGPMAGKEMELEIEGPIQSLAEDQLVIRGQTVLLTEETEITGIPSERSFAKVEAARQEDGSLLALKIIVTKDKNEKLGPKAGRERDE